MIRPSTKPELAIIRSAWTKTFNPSQGHGDLKDGLMLWGSNRLVSPALTRRMLSRMVDEVATEETVLVYDVDGIPLSVICRELVEKDGEPRFVAVHFVYTVAKARRKNLATMLLQYVCSEANALEIPIRETAMTPNGRALKRAFDG